MRLYRRNVLPSLALLGASTLFISGCDFLDSATSTTIVGGILLRTPEIQVDGALDVPAEVVATAYVGERESATSTAEPNPIRGANVQVTFAGNTIALQEQTEPNTEGFYMENSIQSMSLEYTNTTYAFDARLPGSADTRLGGSVTAPLALTPAAITLSPSPMPDTLPMGIDGRHAPNTQLVLTWPTQHGKHGYVVVLRADLNDVENPQLVYDNRPETAGDLLQFVLGTPPSELTVPASAFAQDGVYAVTLVTLDKGEPFSGTFLGSPFLAGSGATVVLGVGELGL